MKKFIFSLIATFAATFVFGQLPGTPRFGTTPATNYTFTSLTGVLLAPKTHITGGLDTFRIYPNAYTTIVNPIDSIQDSVVFIIPSNYGAHIGDGMDFQGICNNAAVKTKIKFRNGTAGNGAHLAALNTWSFAVTAGDSTIALTAKQRFLVKWRFDGSKWVETGKIVK